MRLLPDPIEQAMITGNFVGESKWQVRVTVEPDWYLQVLAASESGTLDRKWVPLRYWQREANDQVEVEVPNLLTYEFDRSLEQSAASCTLTFDNVKMEPNLSGSNRRLGMKGYYAPHYGATAEARGRWDQVPHEWAGVLDGNALLRTYAGVGGEDMDVHVAVAAGNLMLDGVWLVDDWRTTSAGTLILTCRDMMALAIDQPIYPPLTPAGAHPLEFYRWRYDRRAVTAGPRTFTETQVQPGVPAAAGDKRMVFIDSSVDRWYPAAAPGSQVPNGGYVLLGHKGTDSLDGDPNTFALSVGNSHPSKTFCTDWWTYACGEHVNAIYLHPWAGNYTVYVSILENGEWQGDQEVPYEFYPMNGAGRAVDTGANIPYVTATGVPWETAIEIQLPRVYLAEQIRISFREHTYTPWGQWHYRCGIREVRSRLTSSMVIGGSNEQASTTVQPLFYGGDSLRDPDDLNREGYATVSTFGQVDIFGDADSGKPTGGDRRTDAYTHTLALTADGLGAWVLRYDGGVTTYGTAPFYGSPHSDGDRPTSQDHMWTDIQPTPSGLGYWVVNFDGRIAGYGDATDYTAVTPPAGEVVSRVSPHPTSQGLWILLSNGQVHVRGACVDYGDYTATIVSHANDYNWAADIQGTGTGLGYWILAHDGTVQAFGDAVHYGHISDGGATRDHYQRHHQLLPSPTDTGYLILRGDGDVFPFGTIYYAGGPVPGTTGEIRRDGNIRDFADIVYLLAGWCGFHLYNAFNDNGKPSIYGNIETTGSFPKDTMPLDFFDKKIPADVMKQLAELHGFVGPYCDEEGGFRWHCVDDKTEILTRSGWRRHADLVAGDEVLGLNPETDKTEWIAVETVNRYDVDDAELISMEGRDHSSLTTPNHRWWTSSTSKRGRARWDTSSSLNAWRKIPTAAPYGNTLKTHKDDFVELVAWWICEGTLGETGTAIDQSHTANPRHVEHIDALLRGLYGEPGSLRTADWARSVYPSKPSMTRFRLGRRVRAALLAAAPEKVPSNEFLDSLTTDQAAIFVDACIAADGNTYTVKGYPHRRWTQKCPRRVAAFERAAILAGLRPSIHRIELPKRDHDERRLVQQTADSWKFEVQLSTRRFTNPHNAASLAGGAATVTRRRYTGTVWCPTLERHQVWLARRNGTIYFTGNSPNYWNFGNFLLDGTYTTTIPELDERWNLLESSVSGTKRNDRSEIILSTEEPTEALSTTVTTRFTPPNQARLRGMSRPVVWVLPSLVSAREQRVMAELVAMHLWFRSRLAQVTGVYHPGISVNDQVRILDEATGETNIHYVLSKRGSFDRRTGVFTMSIDAHWLGDGTTWAIRLPDTAAMAAAERQFALSALTIMTLRARGIDLTSLEGATKLTHFGSPATPAAGVDGQATP